jgi:hypothetical protein
MEIDMDFRARYTALVERHVGRRPRRGDGLSASEIRTSEGRLGCRVPDSLRAYYLLAGRLDELNKAHNLLYAPKELRVEDGVLVFMEENQAVVHWGVKVKDLGKADPMVYQKVNEEGARWYSERMSISKFLDRMYDWQAGVK